MNLSPIHTTNVQFRTPKLGILPIKNLNNRINIPLNYKMHSQTNLLNRSFRLYSQKTEPLEKKQPKDYPSGDFSFFQDNEGELVSSTGLTNAYNAVTRLNVWEFFDKNVPRGGYFRWDHETLNKIGSELDSDGHSGMSFALTMRWMEKIRKKGWENTIVDYKRELFFKGEKKK